MKYLAGFLTLIVAITFSLFPQAVRADTTYVSTGDLNCVNGNCTSDSSTSTSKVCCNGKCTTSDNPNVSVQDINGNCQINFGNVPTSSLTATPEQAAESTPSGTLTLTPTDIPTSTPVPPTASPEATITPDPTIMQMRKDINNQVEKQMQTLKQHLKNQDHVIFSFFHSGVDALQSFFSGLFK